MEVKSQEFLTPALDGDGLIASRSSCLLSGERALGTDGIEVWVEPRANLNVVKGEISRTRLESNPISLF
jgi:hypothetical protein